MNKSRLIGSVVFLFVGGLMLVGAAVLAAQGEPFFRVLLPASVSALIGVVGIVSSVVIRSVATSPEDVEEKGRKVSGTIGVAVASVVLIPMGGMGLLAVATGHVAGLMLLVPPVIFGGIFGAIWVFGQVKGK
jgi:hypothetical protein